MNLCDFFLISRWIRFKGLEKSVIQLAKDRNAYLQGTLDEFLQNINGEGWQNKRLLFETLLFLQ